MKKQEKGMTKGVRSESNALSAPHVSMLNQRVTAGRQYREPWLDSENAASWENKITILVMHLIFNNYEQRG